MAEVDKRASQFAMTYGDKLRASSFSELSKNLGQFEEKTELSMPDELKPYRFSLIRAPLKDGRIRLIVEGWRPILWGMAQSRAINAFDVFPDGTIKEIPKSDEDYCGRT